LAARAIAAMGSNGPARRGHADVLKANTGWFIDPVKWAKRATASRLLAEHSETIADALERMGEPARLESNITAIGAVTGVAEALPAYRAIRFLPAVAARDRRPVLNGMKYFIQHHPHSRFFRYAVITASEPVPFVVNSGRKFSACRGASRNGRRKRETVTLKSCSGESSSPVRRQPIGMRRLRGGWPRPS